MSKRLILPIVLLLLAVSLGAAVLLSSEPMAEEPLTVTIFEQYSPAQNTLTAERVSHLEATAAVAFSGSRLRMEGAIPAGKPYRIFAEFDSGEWTAAADISGNYAVLSLLPFKDTLRVVLADNTGQNMYYLDLAMDQPDNAGAYRVNWYLSFLEPKIEESLTPDSAENRSASKIFAATASVYGDTYREVLTLSFVSDWDSPVSAGMGYMAKATMKLASKTTEVTRAGESVPTVWEGNSLQISHIIYTAATPYGEYIRKIESRLGNMAGENHTVGFGVGVGMPDAPFSIDALSLTTEETRRTDRSAVTFYPNGDYPMAAKLDYSDGGLVMGRAAHDHDVSASLSSITVETTLKTADDYIRPGQKGFSYRWDYCVTSGGTAAAPIAAPQSYQNTLFYTLEA